MLLTVVYLLVKLTSLMFLCVFKGSYQCRWPYCPVEHLFSRAILFYLYRFYLPMFSDK